MNRKHDPSTDRFRAGRRRMERMARKFSAAQTVFPWFEHALAVSSAKDPAPSQMAFEFFRSENGRANR